HPLAWRLGMLSGRCPRGRSRAADVADPLGFGSAPAIAPDAPVQPAAHRSPGPVVFPLGQVPGVHALFVDGQSAGRVSPEQTSYEVPLTTLSDRNRILLELVIPGLSGPAAALAPEWGAIALVIRTPDAPPPP